MRWIFVVCAACVVVRPPLDAERPAWRLTTTEQIIDTDCVIARALVRKSGKQGIGLAVALHSRRDCDFTPTQITLALRGGATKIFATPAPTLLHGRSLLYAWVPLAFDNNAAWNAGDNTGTLTIAFTSEGKPRTWSLAMEQR